MIETYFTLKALQFIPNLGTFEQTIFNMGKNTSILLGEYFETFVSNEIATGKYSSVSEVVRTALRLLEVEEQKSKKLRDELEIGENSPAITDFNPKKHLAELHKKHL